MNNITIAGPLGRDSELRSIPSGEQVLSFSVADSAGRDKPTIWWNCQLWGKRAASLGPYLTKGQQVAVSGSVSEREWTDKDGAKRKTLEVRVSDVALQGKPQTSEPASRPQQRPVKDFDDDSDVPF
jgi:single-strand DNA-binding protein